MLDNFSSIMAAIVHRRGGATARRERPLCNNLFRRSLRQKLVTIPAMPPAVAGLPFMP